MRLFTLAGVDYEVPDIEFVEEQDNNTVLEIVEGEFKDTQFYMTNMRMDEEDGGLMWYDLHTTDNVDNDKLKVVVDNFILSMLYDRVKFLESENENKVIVGFTL